MTWDIRRAGYAWRGEAMSRYEMTPEKTELIAGKLYGTEEERLLWDRGSFWCTGRWIGDASSRLAA